MHVIDHPLVQHKLALMRRKTTSTANFRKLLNEVGSLMAYEVTRDVPTQEVEIETPLEVMKARMIDGKKLVFVPILRAGTGLLDGFLAVIPGARVGHVGLYRDPVDAAAGRVLLQDAERHARARRRSCSTRCSRPATRRCRGRAAEAASAALDPPRLPGRRARRAARRSPTRIPTCRSTRPPSTAQLNDHGYILPGLGDAGDRIFGTK